MFSTIILFSLVAVGLVFLTKLYFRLKARAEEVYRYRLDLYDRMKAASLHDLRAKKETFCLWRLEKFLEVSDEEMVFKFWKPLDSFYPDKSFAEIQE